MIKELPQSKGNLLVFEVSGTVTKDDYQNLVPPVQKAVDADGSVKLMFDATDFVREETSAWSTDLDFGEKYHSKVSRMAIVGLSEREADFLKPFDAMYAQEAKYFDKGDQQTAMAWLEGK